MSRLLAQEDYALKKIEFEGNRAFSNDELLAQMTMQPKTGFAKLLFWKPSERYSVNLQQRDARRLVTFYQTEGFLDAKIDTVLVDADDEHREVRLKIKISEGTPISLRHIEYVFDDREGMDGVDFQLPFRKVRNALQLHEGDRYRDVILQQDRDRIIESYSHRGFPYIQIRPVPRIEATAKVVDFVFHIDTGPRCVFGEVSVVGNKKTPSEIIRRQLAFYQGQIFDQELVQKSQRQVYLLGLFSFVSIKLLLSEEQDTVLPVQVIVKEAPRLTMKFGIGYGKEDSFRGFTDIRRLGFLGGARRMTFYAKHSGLEPFNINLKLTQPGFVYRQASLTLNPFYRREQEPAFKVDRIGGNLSLQNRFLTYIDGYLNYTLEQDDLTASADPQAAGPDISSVQLINKSSVTVGLTRDNSSPLFSPDHGMLNSLIVTYSGLGFKSVQFLRMLVETRYYEGIAENWTFATRLKMGTIRPLGSSEITAEERFYSGGSNSVRGWRRSELGPKDPKDVPLGGNSLLEGSGELRYPIWGWLSGVVFLDFGYVWQQTSTYHLDRLRYAAGAGLRLSTPIGPIRFDMASPVPKKDLPLEFHISVGQAF